MMTRVMPARERGKTEGFMKVVVDVATERVRGAAILGLGGLISWPPAPLHGHLAHGTHPTVAEYLSMLLGDLAPVV